MRPIYNVMMLVLCVLIFVLIPSGNDADGATSITVVDSGVIQMVSTAGDNITETFAVAPEWVDRGVRCALVTAGDHQDAMERAQELVSIPRIKVVGISLHRDRHRVESVEIFYILDADYDPPPVGFRGEEQKTLWELINEVAP